MLKHINNKQLLMRKQWIKRENIYHKPFYKQKLKMSLCGVFLMALIFFVYQIICMNQLQRTSRLNIRLTNEENDKKSAHLLQETINETGRKGPHTAGLNTQILRGIRLRDYDLYSKSITDKFKCFKSTREIPFEWVNDDYCDCIEDGSDEPATNACPVGVFYCKYQIRDLMGHGTDVSIHNSRINDGICDCCDGSDEWRLPYNLCTNNCPLVK